MPYLAEEIVCDQKVWGVAQPTENSHGKKGRGILQWESWSRLWWPLGSCQREFVKPKGGVIGERSWSNSELLSTEFGPLLPTKLFMATLTYPGFFPCCFFKAFCLLSKNCYKRHGLSSQHKKVTYSDENNILYFWRSFHGYGKNFKYLPSSVVLHWLFCTSEIVLYVSSVSTEIYGSVSWDPVFNWASLQDNLRLPIGNKCNLYWSVLGCQN